MGDLSTNFFSSEFNVNVGKYNITPALTKAPGAPGLSGDAIIIIRDPLPEHNALWAGPEFVSC